MSILDLATVNGSQRLTLTGVEFKNFAKTTTLIIFMAVGGRDLKSFTLQISQSIDSHNDLETLYGSTLGMFSNNHLNLLRFLTLMLLLNFRSTEETLKKFYYFLIISTS